MRISDWSSDVCSSDLRFAPVLVTVDVLTSCRPSSDRPAAPTGVEHDPTKPQSNIIERHLRSTPIPRSTNKGTYGLQRNQTDKPTPELRTQTDRSQRGK